MTVRFNKQARQELGAQLAYLGAANPDAALHLLAEIERGLGLLDEGLADGNAVSLRSGRQARRWVVPPLVLFYRRQGATVIVLRVRHGAQRPITRGG